MENGYSLADMAAATGNSMGGFGCEGLWIFALLLLLFGSNGFGFGGNAATNALTQQDALINSNFDNLARNVQSISDRQYEQANNLTKGICELGYTMAQQTNGLQTNLGGAIVNEGRSLQQQISDCCCNNVAMNAETKAAIHAEGEATRNLIQQNKIAELEQAVSDLKTQSYFCGVPRISPYGYTINPAWGTSCNCYANI